MSLEIRLTFDTEAAQRRFEALREVGPKALAVAARRSLLLLVRHVTRQKLMGQVLRRRTGTLIRSITASPRVEVTPNVVRGTFGSHLGYAQAHEEGFTGTVSVRAHVRRVRARDVRARVEGRRRIIARGIAVVRAHSRRVNLRPRYFLRATMKEKAADVQRRFARALRIATMTGRVPQAGDLE